MSEPKEPDYSCPNLDKAIDEIEEARKIHDALRKWGQYWKDEKESIENNFEEFKKEKEEEQEVKEAELDGCKDRIIDLEREIEELKQEINNSREAVRVYEKYNS